MTEQEATEAGGIAAENAGLKEENALQQEQLEHLRENSRTDKLEIDDLRNARTNILQLNRDLAARMRALDELNKEMESFSYAVSHDLRSPLRSIHGFSEALHQSAQSKLSPMELEWLKKISSAAARMDRLTEDLLRLSRISRLQLKREPVDLTKLARDVIADLRQSEPNRNVAFAISDSLEAHADRVLMRVLLSNLLGNAWKYTGRCPQALISFGTELRNSVNIFCIRDNGAGFDMVYAAKLFTPFQRLHSAREFPGTGVGLACVARVVHKHGGRIWADAKTGEGAAFYFTLPTGVHGKEGDWL